MYTLYNGFDDWDDIMNKFMVDEREIEPKYVFADYDQDGYEGFAKIYYSDNGKEWFIVEGSHCSCYGLERQWEPSKHEAQDVEKMIINNTLLKKNNSKFYADFYSWWCLVSQDCKDNYNDYHI